MAQASFPKTDAFNALRSLGKSTVLLETAMVVDTWSWQ